MHIYDKNSDPTKEPFAKPVYTAKLYRDMAAGYAARIIRAALRALYPTSNDIESMQNLRLVRLGYWLDRNKSTLMWTGLALVVALIAVTLAWISGKYIHTDTEPVVLPSGDVVLNQLRCDALFVRRPGDDAISAMARRTLNASAIDAASLRAGYYVSGWRGRTVNVSIACLDRALRDAPINLCVTATALGLDGLAVRPPHFGRVYYLPSGQRGASSQIEVHRWPTADAIDPFVAGLPTEFYVPRQQYYSYLTVDGSTAVEKLEGTAVACMEYAQQLSLRVGRAVS